jgi:4-hydroxy 2-oxovalerate aldolase
MSIRITDCTIRDGGYLLNKNSDPAFVKGIMKGLADAGIDFVETGFLQTNVTGETLVYANSVDARKYLPAEKGRTQFLGFCDNSRYSADDLDPYDGQSFRWLRISFAKHEIDESLEFCRRAQEMGYTVQFNPMDAISYSDDERAALIEKTNRVKPGSMSIVDTFGAMYLEDLRHIFQQMDALLDPGIAIGLHSHDNLGLSTALAETMIMLAQGTGRDVIVDGSLFGMGRGAGNASTELLASYLNQYHGADYDIPALLSTIHTFIDPIRESVHWGYDLPMFVCGTEHAHVDNVYYLQKHTDATPTDMYAVIQSMPVPQRTRYGTGYNKTDFSNLQAAYEKFKEEGQP